MKFQYVLLALISSLGLLACANQTAPQSNFSEVFTPRITVDGEKLFTYSLVDLSSSRKNMPKYRQQELDRGTKSLDETRRKRKLKTSIARQKEELIAKLDLKLADNGYCPNGRTIINSYIQDSHSGVEGKCNSLATQADKENFSAAVKKVPGAIEGSQDKALSDILK